MTIELSQDPPALTPELAALLALIAVEDGPPVDPTLLPPVEGRALAARSNARWNVDLPAMARVGETLVPADAELGSAKCRVKALVPELAQAGALLFVHGGGFAFCSPETHERCARLLARECRLPVLMPDYRLSPEHPYPAGLRDVIACLRTIAASPALFGADRGPLLVAGDSAGANLALAAALAMRDAGERALRFQLLIYGCFSTDCDSPSWQRFGQGAGLNQANMRWIWETYLERPEQKEDWRAAPTLGDLKGVAAAHLIVGSLDPLLDDSNNLAAKLTAAGVPHDLTIYPGINHGFIRYGRLIGTARKAIAECAAALKAGLSA
jgi:acetyl esterase